MKGYLIVQSTQDGLGVEQLSVRGEFPTRPEAVKASKGLPPGTYGLLSVLRGEFTVRESLRVVNTVVDWGETSKPRPRKAASGTSKKKSSSKARSTSGGTKFFNDAVEETNSHA